MFRTTTDCECAANDYLIDRLYDPITPKWSKKLIIEEMRERAAREMQGKTGYVGCIDKFKEYIRR